MNEDFLQRKLQQRRDDDAFRSLTINEGGIDFCSNDYLGIARKKLLSTGAHGDSHGSTGSRLISGNYELIESLEKQLAIFHEGEAALVFNSGYDANMGLLGSVAERGDTIIYDALSHASLRDGIRLSLARSFSFRHNDINDLEKKLQQATGNIFVITESVFSMDGDFAPLQDLQTICEKYRALIIVDEAHATGVVGNNGAGLVQHLGLQHKCFARIHTFGKALGCHGAVIIGSATLRDYLINFSRPFIYTTAIPASSVAAIGAAYALFPSMHSERDQLAALVDLFRQKSSGMRVCVSSTPIQGIIIPGNERVKAGAAVFKQNGLDVRPILYPTVPLNEERLRIVLHAYNTADELDRLFEFL